MAQPWALAREFTREKCLGKQADFYPVLSIEGPKRPGGLGTDFLLMRKKGIALGVKRIVDIPAR